MPTAPKKFSLKPIETQLLSVLNQQYASTLSNVLSFIAIERLAVNVTGNTHFVLNDDATEVTISETDPEPPAEGEVITDTSKGKK